MSKKLLINQVRHLAKNPPPTAKSLLAEEEYDYLITLCPNWEEAEKNKLAVLLIPSGELPLVNRILGKLAPLEMTVGKINVVDAEKRGEKPGSVSPEEAEALKRMMRKNTHT